MSQHAEGTFQGASGGPVYWQSWSPGDAKAAVVLSHGLHEHSGRYAHVADRLNAGGYAVYALDHRGHGRSAGTVGNVERFAHLDTDLGELLSRARTEHAGRPVFLLGHSLGALIALDFVVTKGESGLAGLVLSGAAVDPSVGNPVQKAFAGLLSRYAPNLGVLLLDSTAVSRDPEVVQKYLDDPHVYNGKVRARTGAETLLSTVRVIQGLPRLHLPVLILHGTKDRLTSPGGSKLIAERIGSVDKTLTLYDGLFHEIFNEPERDQVLDDVVAWLDKHS